MKFYPNENGGGGAEKVLAMLKGEHKMFWGSFFPVASEVLTLLLDDKDVRGVLIKSVFRKDVGQQEQQQDIIKAQSFS